MSVALQRDIGAFLAVAAGGRLGTGLVATSTGNSGTTNIYRGATHDRLSVTRRYLSAKLVITGLQIHGSATGAQPSYTVTPAVQDSADGVTWTDYTGDGDSPTAQTRYVGGSSAASASSTGTPALGEQAVFSLDVNLSRARRYIRASATAVVGSSSTATQAPSLALDAAWVFGGADTVPA
jgi:hypothetical protein